MKHILMNSAGFATTLALAGMLVLAPALAADASGGTTTDTAVTKVAIDNYAFKPPTITVCVGKPVSWKNMDDDPHTVTAVDGSFDSKGLGQGDAFRFVFDKAGKYEYYCKVHPFMKGVVIVKECGS